MNKKSLLGKKSLIAFALVLLIGGGIYYYFMTEKTPVEDPGQKAITIEKQDLISTVSATGTIEASDSVEIGSKISGRLEKVYIEENSFVSKGELLMELDKDQLMSQLRQTQAKLDNALATYQRYQKLFSQGAIAAQTLEDAEREYRVADAAHQNVLSQVEDTQITAPISGIVIGEPMSTGETVSAGTANVMVLATLANLDKMEIQTLVDESDIGHVKEGMSATFSVDTYQEKSYMGTVTKISKAPTTSNNVIYYAVTVMVENPEGLLPGMTAQVTIETARKNAVIALPLRYVYEEDGKKWVKVLSSDKKIESREVTTGFSTDEFIEIVTGLIEGDQVVLNNTKSNKQPASMRIPRM